jgi:hypothetical protein
MVALVGLGFLDPPMKFFISILGSLDKVTRYTQNPQNKIRATVFVICSMFLTKTGFGSPFAGVDY